MPESGLGLQDLTARYEEGGHAVSEPVQGGIGNAGGVSHSCEAVAEGGRVEAVSVRRIERRDAFFSCKAVWRTLE